MAYFFPETQNLINPQTISILRKSLLVEWSLFRQELIALSVISIFMGYQLSDIGITFFQEFRKITKRKSQTISEKCPHCKIKPFSLVNPPCKHIICCQECREKVGDYCHCGTALAGEMIKLYI